MTDPAGVVQLCNMALARVGVAQIITSLSDGSDSSVQCNVWYGQCRDALLRDFPWPWAQGFAVLNQISAAGEWANAQWLYSYRYPTDCLYARKISFTRTPALLNGIPVTPVTNQVPTSSEFTWLREDGDPLPYPFAIGHDTDGRLIFTNCPAATLWYTVAVTDPMQFSPDFSSLLAWRLAKELAIPLTSSNDRRKWAEEMYDQELRKARAMALNESQSSQPLIIAQSEVARARFGG